MPKKARLAIAFAALLSLPALLLAARRPDDRRTLDVPAWYPEGDTVIAGSIHWAEMVRDRVRRIRNGKAETVWERPSCGPTAVRPRPDGDIWVLCHLSNEVALVGPDWKTKAIFRTDIDGNRLYRPNDGKVSESGDLYFSSAGEFDIRAPSTGYVVLLRKDGYARRISGPYQYTNGISVTPDGTRLYVSEHLAQKVWELRLDGERVVSRRVFFDFNDAGLARTSYNQSGPDGQWLAPNGDLFIANYGGGRLIQLSAAGHLKRVIPVKTAFVTNMYPSPYRSGRLVVTGTYDIREATSLGAVFEIDMPR